MRLLCVEDETALREDIVEFLRMKAYDVDEASTGEEAIERLNHGHYDLVLCDIKMPRMDGYELLRQVRSENSMVTTPFLFLSALNERDDKIRAHSNGCDGYLTKPIDFSVLDATVRSHVERQRAREFMFNAVLGSTRRHIMTVIDDALNGPISQAALVTQHLRDTLPTLTPAQLGMHLDNLQELINTHMLRLHAFYSAMLLQHHPVVSDLKQGLVDDIILQAVQECRYQYPTSPMKFKASPPNGALVIADLDLLRHAIAGLISTLPQAQDSCDVIRSYNSEQGQFVLTIYDTPEMATSNDENFVVIDESTNLISLSSTTRERLVALTYAMQVAHAHNGRVEINIWPDGKLAVRMVLPQPTSSKTIM